MHVSKLLPFLRVSTSKYKPCAQVMVVPISNASIDYALEVKAAFKSETFSVDIDLADNKMEKKIREAQLEQYNYMMVRTPAETYSSRSPPVQRSA